MFKTNLALALVSVVSAQNYSSTAYVPYSERPKNLDLGESCFLTSDCVSKCCASNVIIEGYTRFKAGEKYTLAEKTKIEKDASDILTKGTYGTDKAGAETVTYGGVEYPSAAVKNSPQLTYDKVLNNYYLSTSIFSLSNDICQNKTSALCETITFDFDINFGELDDAAAAAVTSAYLFLIFVFIVAPIMCFLITLTCFCYFCGCCCFAAKKVMMENNQPQYAPKQQEMMYAPASQTNTSTTTMNTSTVGMHPGM